MFGYRKNNKSFSLLRYFSVISLVCIILSAIILGWFYRVVSINQLIQHGEDNNIVLAQTLANTIWPHFIPYSLATNKLTFNEVRQHPETKKLRKFVINQISETPVLKIKIFNLTGMTLFSTEVEQIGVQKEANYQGSLSATSGEINSKLSRKKEFMAINQVVFDRQIISSYLPMRNPETNKTEGVFEVYYDVTKLFSGIKKKQIYLSIGVILVLSLLYGILYFVIRHADYIIRTQEEALTLSRDDALKANEAKSYFLANMSHEIRTPLHAIIGYSELIHEELADNMKAFAPDLMKIRDAGDHLLSLINTILDISKIEAGKMDVFIEPVDIKLNTTLLISTIEPLAKKNNNKLFLDCPDSIGDMKTDLTMYRQIILNVCSNAAKFTQNGMINIQLSAKTFENKEWIIIRVIDDGVGMSPEQLTKVFDDFSQAEQSTTRNFGGTGLGLSITKRLCTLLGGDIFVESEIYKGSIFTVELPRYTSQKQSLENKKEDVSKNLQCNPEKVRNKEDFLSVNRRISTSSVLIIDDDDVVCELLERFLLHKGFKVYVAKTVDKGLQLARKEQPNIILLDINVPEKNGHMTLAELKADEQISHIPVIIQSLVADKLFNESLDGKDRMGNTVKFENLANAIIALVRSTS